MSFLKFGLCSCEPNEQVPGKCPFGTGGDGGGTRWQIPRICLIWCTPKDAFIGAHSVIRVETGIPVSQMGNPQESVEWGRGSDMVYGSEMYRCGRFFEKLEIVKFKHVGNRKTGFL